MKISIILSSYKRPHLLRLGLSSMVRFRPNIAEHEILVLNDGIPDETENVCKYYSDKLNIRYIFTGKRNLDGIMKKRVSGHTLNIGIKRATGDIIILSNPEIYHLNNAVDILIHYLIHAPKSMVIPNFIYFDRIGTVTSELNALNDEQLMYPYIKTDLLVGGLFGEGHCAMPYLMAIYRHEIMTIGGYDEDFTGYAGEDNDFVDRLKLNGVKHLRTPAMAIHLYHEGTGDGSAHWDNPAWVHNYTLLQNRRGILVRNVGREWGKLDE